MMVEPGPLSMSRPLKQCYSSNPIYMGHLLGRRVCAVLAEYKQIIE
jgi:hypothetical protein